MFEKTAAFCAPYEEQLGLVIRRMGTDDVLAIHPERVFPSASVIKMAVLWEFYRRVSEGSLQEDQTFVLRDSMKVGETPYDTGILRDFHDGIQLTLEDVVTMMVVISDDTATNILLDLLGIDQINRTMADLGLSGTRVQRRMMEYDKVRAGIDNETCAQDMDLLFREIFASRKLRTSCHEKMQNILLRQRYHDSIPRYFPEDMKIAHKTGTIGEFGLEHDVGVICGPKGEPLLGISVFSRHLDNAADTIGRIAQTAYQELTGAL